MNSEETKKEDVKGVLIDSFSFSNNLNNFNFPEINKSLEVRCEI